jgi:hypothetical protein
VTNEGIRVGFADPVTNLMLASPYNPTVSTLSEKIVNIVSRSSFGVKQATAILLSYCSLEIKN